VLNIVNHLKLPFITDPLTGGPLINRNPVSKERQYKVKGQKVKAYNDLQNTTNKTREGLSNTTPLNNWE
jgi:hypothetical protein